MDKRLSIALLLTAIVVAVTPIMFPTPRRTPETATVTDSLRRDTIPDVVTQQIAPPTAIPTDSDSTTERVDSATATSTPGMATPQITTVSTSTSDYRFSNVGAV